MNQDSLDEDRNIEKYKDLSDAEAEALIDDAVAFATLCLDLMDSNNVKKV